MNEDHWCWAFWFTIGVLEVLSGIERHWMHSVILGLPMVFLCGFLLIGSFVEAGCRKWKSFIGEY